MTRVVPIIALLLQCCAAFDDCSVYMADSSIPNAGYGVFAAQNFLKGERIGAPSVGIVLVDYVNPNFHFGRNQTGITIQPKHATPLNDYLWPTSAIGGFGEGNDTRVFLPGLASLANHHSMLANVLPSGLKRDTRTTPSATSGANTPYHSYTMIAKRDIAAGEELFVDQTLLSIVPSTRIGFHTLVKSTETYPLTSYFPAEVYARADSIVQGLAENMEKLSSITDAQWIDILYRLRRDLIQKHEPMVVSLLPKTKHDLMTVYRLGTAKAQLHHRSLSWIKSHGQCLDHIRQGIRKTQEDGAPHPGFGAFATRTLSEGQIVTPAPLVPVANPRNVFHIPTGHTAPDKLKKGVREVQLLLNYCFGHGKQPNLRLCPTTNIALINHSSDRHNAKLVWGTSSTNRKSMNDGMDALFGSLQEFVNAFDGLDPTSYTTQLSFNVVATRQIVKGEEILIDYGTEWERALEKHSQVISTQLDDYVATTAYLWDQQQHELIRSSELAAINPSISYECDLYPSVKEYPAGSNVHHEKFASNTAVDPQSWTADSVAWYQDGKNIPIRMYPCEVDGATTSDAPEYNISLYSKALQDHRIIRKYTNCPRDRVHFVQAPYTSDQHLPWSFRYFIPVPDALFPLRWRQDYKTTESWKLGVAPEARPMKDADALYEKALRAVKCGAYVAPSTIPNAGFGMYTAVDVPAKGVIISTTHPALPYTDSSVTGVKWVGSDYVWSGATAGFELETGPHVHTSLFSVLYGCLTNSHAGIINIAFKSPHHQAILDRKKDPGAGGFSDYLRNGHVSLLPISAGQELFTSYGDGWWTNRKQFRDVPLMDDFHDADMTVALFLSLMDMDGARINDGDVETLMKVIRENIVQRPRLKSALELVKTVDDIHKVRDVNGTAPSTSGLRTQEWFEKNGQCIDHIHVQPSTIEQAGKGAFARRVLKTDSVIISTPLVALYGNESISLNGSGIPPHANQDRLLYNYMFGHRDSSVSFIPSTQLMAANHKSDEPNAELRWATWHPKSNYFLHRPLEDLKKEKYSVLVLDLVATREIQPDEEVFIDYGADWENAWNSHVENWKDPCSETSSNPCFKSSFFVQSLNSPEQKFKPQYHDWSEDHYSRCVVPSQEIMNSRSIRIIDGHSGQNQQHRGRIHYKGVGWNHPGFRLAKMRTANMLPCKIVSFDAQQRTFDVLLFQKDRDLNVDARVVVHLENLPAKDLSFYTRPFKSDMFHKDAFRHNIGIPDEIFPEIWKDL